MRPWIYEWMRTGSVEKGVNFANMNKRTLAGAGGIAVLIAVGVWHFLLGSASFNDHGAVAATIAPESVAASHLTAVDPKPVTLRAKDAPAGSLWVRRSPKDAERRAWRKRLELRYRRLGASQQFIDQMVVGNKVEALKRLKQQALSGNATAIRTYADFTYWNCFAHRTPEQMDSYTEMQMQESRSLPAPDAEWFRDAFAEAVATEKEIAAACHEAVNVDQAFDMMQASAEQGDAENLYLSALTARTQPEQQRMMRAAAIAGSADAQFEIAWLVLGGHQTELLGTGPDALNVGDLLRQSAAQIPQAEGTLAICEFSGCDGIAADSTAAIHTALSAAEHGFFEGLQNIAPHLSPSQLDPTDVEAWNLIHASVNLQCGESWTNVQAMRSTLDALSSPAATDSARKRAEQLWAQYGAALGC